MKQNRESICNLIYSFVFISYNSLEDLQIVMTIVSATGTTQTLENKVQMFLDTLILQEVHLSFLFFADSLGPCLLENKKIFLVEFSYKIVEVFYGFNIWAPGLFVRSKVHGCPPFVKAYCF